MENFILGFESNLSQYPMREILFWILEMGLLYFIIGRFIEKRSIVKDYFHLIRYASLKKWWMRLCGKVFLLCVLGILLLFFIAIVFQYIGQFDNIPSVAMTVRAYMLYLANVTLFSFLMILIINCWNEERISFAIVILMEIFSLYGGIISSSLTCYLPGSIAMYRRSSWYVMEGFQATGLLTVEIGVAVTIFRFGYKGLERGKRNG